MKEIRVFDNGGETADRYEVMVDGHAWDMSENADQANGVCMYAGYDDGPYINEKQLGDMPKGVLIQIIRIINTWEE